MVTRSAFHGRSARPARKDPSVPLAIARALVVVSTLTIALSTALLNVTTGPTESVTAPVAAVPRPNIVVVMADDMRFDDLRFAPQLRRLARHGVTFENSFSPFPLCCPARASFLLGQLAHNHEVWWHEKPYGYGAFDDSRTLATSMQSAGYRTGFVGKYLNGYGQHDSRVSGKPSYRYVPRGWTDWYAAFTNPGIPTVRGGTYNYFSTPFNINGAPRNHRGDYQTGVIGDYSRQLIEKYHRTGKPFFLYVNYVAPHFGGPDEADDPRRVRDRRGHIEEIKTPARPNWVKGRFDSVIDRAAGVPRQGGPVERDVSDKPRFVRQRPELSREVRRAGKVITRQRAEAIFVMDREIGRTVRLLRRSGEWGSTVFVFTSDNGYYLGEHRIVQGKLNGHEPSLRIPLLMAGPGLRDGSSRFDPITTVDLSATLLDLASAEAPLPADGTSLVDSLTEGDQGWDSAVPIESAYRTPRRSSIFGDGEMRHSIGVRTARYTYIRYSSGATELYDLARDPHQLRSRHDDPDYDAARRALRGVWTRLRNCRAAACRVELPHGLSTSAADTGRLTREWLTQHQHRHGWG